MNVRPTVPSSAEPRRDVDPMTHPRGRRRPGEEWAKGMGWFSLGLGVTALVAPGVVARLIGVDRDRSSDNVIRFVGARELATGVGLLRRPEPSLLWGRVAQDVMDLALLGAAARSDNAHRGRLAATTAVVLGATALDVYGATRGRPRGHHEGEPTGITVREAVTIRKPPEEVYRFFRDFENLPTFMRHLESVEVLDATRSRWTTKGPAGRSVHWDAEITDDRVNERIVWRSLPGADVANVGTVRFTPAPGGRGTELRVDLHYDPPAGRLGAAFAKLFREAPEQQMKDDLRRLKQVLETGAIVISDASRERGLHPGQPHPA